jgi:hypothetical protein
MPTSGSRWLRIGATVATIGLVVLFCGAFVRDDLIRGDYETVARWGRAYNRVLLVWSLLATCLCGVVAAREESVGFGAAAAASLVVAILVWFVSSLPSGMLM